MLLRRVGNQLLIVSDDERRVLADVYDESLARQFAASGMMLDACRAHQALLIHGEHCPSCGVGLHCLRWNELLHIAHDLTAAAIAQAEGKTEAGQ